MSRNTLLRLLGRQPGPSLPTPRVLGVDDFALRKRHTYGTILVDLARRQPVALLPERTAEPVGQWLALQEQMSDNGTCYIIWRLLLEGHGGV